MKTNYKIIVLLLSILLISVNTGFSQRNKSHTHHQARKHDPHYRYSKLPHWGRNYKAAPKASRVYAHSGVRYHYHNGVYYKPLGNGYVVVRPPVGIRVRTIPSGHVRFVIGGRTYFYYYGTYYVQSNYNEYISVAPPVGAQVDALPDGYRKVEIDGNIYYEFEGTYYKAFIYDNGDVWYEVVGQK